MSAILQLMRILSLSLSLSAKYSRAFFSLPATERRRLVNNDGGGDSKIDDGGGNEQLDDDTKILWVFRFVLLSLSGDQRNGVWVFRLAAFVGGSWEAVAGGLPALKAVLFTIFHGPLESVVLCDTEWLVAVSVKRKQKSIWCSFNSRLVLRGFGVVNVKINGHVEFVISTSSNFLANKKKLLGCVRAFDRHWNMVLENVREMWTKGLDYGLKPLIGYDNCLSEVCMSRRTGFWRKLSGKDLVTLEFQFF
ncbi:hypothetical protein RHSIM_Rhsim09G0198500 [Rhododendron simsii]|uniref:Small nuclear ribonucleoprotein Sm D2 n=1 Tax=Rhododendron simsii TaxID=118357 RepID=A0A834LGK3_RHOSS|nr:hypothetical protein RHSIM_Rhsim09G0198500 [Rhododendron simsii]